MTMRQFIRENRQDIDQYLRDAYDTVKLNDEEREDFIMNDESLYNWAKARRVNI